jgi:catechol 2,3-dioxygenase-like lactoylglutathione lyase family enzyme
MELIRPDYVVLIVEELDRALRFYTEVLGAQFDTGTTRLALYTRRAMTTILGISLDVPTAHAPGFEIGFKVADVDAAFGDLVARGALPVVPPTDRVWGQRTGYVRDPDGHLIELAQDLDRV